MSQGNWILRVLKTSIICLLLTACVGAEDKNLPTIGQQVDAKGDLIPHTVRSFSFVNQFGETITDQKFKNIVYVADFFFTTCKTICPKMTKQLARVQKELKGKDFFILSHTVNPEYDTEKVLEDYAKEMGADFSNWDFVTGRAQKIYRQAASYKVVAVNDTTQDIPFVHSESLVLVDQKKRIRGLYDGTSTQEVDQLIKDIQWLINQQ